MKGTTQAYYYANTCRKEAISSSRDILVTDRSTKELNERTCEWAVERTNEWAYVWTSQRTRQQTSRGTRQRTNPFFPKMCSICFLCVSLQLTVLLDTAVVPEELKPYLSLYLEVIFESPLLRDGGMMCSLNPSTNISFSLRFFENANYL